MGNLSAYNTSTFSGSFDRGNINVAISSSIVSGSTGNIRFGDTPNPPSGGMVIISDSNTQLGIASASATPQFWIINNLNDTASVLNTINALPERINQTRFVTTSSAYLYLVSSSKYFPILGTEPLNTPTTNGLTMYLDANQLVSYPTTASTWYDMSGNNINGALSNGPIFNSSGFFSFDNVDDYVQISSSLNLDTLAATRNMTICFTAKKLFYGTGGNNTGDSMVLIGANNGYNTGFRITEGNTGTPGTPFTGTPLYSFGAPPLANGITVTSPRTGQNTFSYVCFSQSGSSVLGFINGRLFSSTFSNPYSSGASNGAIGRDVGFGVGWFGGYIGNFQIYNRGLSQTEILQNYYQAPIVTDGLVLAVDAGNVVSYESGSTTTYSLTGSFSGSLANGVAYSNINGGSWIFDGTDDYIGLPINAAFNTPSVTYEVWANLQTINDRHILYLNWSGNSFEVNSNRSVTMYNYSSGGQLGATTSAGVFEWDKWVHFVGIYDDAAQTLRTYINGVLSATRTSTPSTIYSVGTHKISGTDYGGEVKGNISVVRHYNRALSASEIQQNFNAQRQRFGV